MNDPASHLGDGVIRMLEQVRERMPADIFGMDFDCRPDGTFVLFEANQENYHEIEPLGDVPPGWMRANYSVWFG